MSSTSPICIKGRFTTLLRTSHCSDHGGRSPIFKLPNILLYVRLLPSKPINIILRTSYSFQNLKYELKTRLLAQLRTISRQLGQLSPNARYIAAGILSVQGHYRLQLNRCEAWDQCVVFSLGRAHLISSHWRYLEDIIGEHASFAGSISNCSHFSNKNSNDLEL